MATYTLLNKTGLATLLTQLKPHIPSTTEFTNLANTVSAQATTISAQDTKITNLTNTVSAQATTISAQDTKITNLTNTVNDLIATITDDEIKAAVNATWPSE